MALQLLNNPCFDQVNPNYASLGFTESIQFYQGLLVGLRAIKLDRNSQQFSEIIANLLNDSKALGGTQYAELTSFLNLIDDEFKDNGEVGLFLPKNTDKPKNMDGSEFSKLCLIALKDTATGILYGLSFSKSKVDYFVEFKHDLEEVTLININDVLDWQSYETIVTYINASLAEIYKNKKITASA